MVERGKNVNSVSTHLKDRRYGVRVAGSYNGEKLQSLMRRGSRQTALALLELGRDRFLTYPSSDSADEQ